MILCKRWVKRFLKKKLIQFWWNFYNYLNLVKHIAICWCLTKQMVGGEESRLIAKEMLNTYLNVDHSFPRSRK